jgi:hypothetical protein
MLSSGVFMVICELLISYTPRGAFNCEFCGETAARAVSLQGVQYHSCNQHIPSLEKMEQQMLMRKEWAKLNAQLYQPGIIKKEGMEKK